MIALPRLGEHIYIARGESRIASETLQLFNDLFCSLGAILKLLISEPHIFSNPASAVFQDNRLTFRTRLL